VHRLPFVSLILGVAVALAACGGSAPEASSAPTAAPTMAVTEPPVSAKPGGKPIVTVDGAKVRVEGIGVGISPQFPLTGNVLMKITACTATGVTPFVVLRSATTNLAPTYVDPETHLKNLSGKYDVEISPAQSCAWVVEFIPE